MVERIKSLRKQIVFVETTPSVPIFKIARALKLTGNYETVLVSFKKIDEIFYKNAFEKIIILELNDVLSIKNFMIFMKKIFSKEGKFFFRQIKKLDPYIVQISGPDIFTLFGLYLFRKNKIIYYAYDIFKPYKKKFSLKKGSGRMIYLNTLLEKLYIRKAKGIIHKGPEGVFKFSGYNISVPSIPFLPGCLEEWCLPYKKKSFKNINIVYAGGAWIKWDGHVSFLDIIKTITDQKIHFHLSSPYFPQINSEKIFDDLKKRNSYFHVHKKCDFNILTKNLSKYNFAIIPDYVYDKSIVNPSFSKITLGSKLFTYMEAGLPIIVSDQMEFMKDIVESNNIGKGVNYNDLKNLRNILLEFKQEDIKKNIKKAQERYSFKRNLPILESFYDKISKI